MTETSPESRMTSGESIIALPHLSEAKAPISLTLTIDKSVGKVAAWVVGLIVAMAMLVGAGIVMSVWMVIAYSQADRDARMVEYYIHEIDGKMIAAGFIKPSQAFDKERIQRELEQSEEKK